jgi:hypothetical protein
MSTNGQLVFTDVDKITFKGVGNTSNAVVDTLTGKIGVGTDSPEANLHVLGNSYVSTNLELGGTLIMGTVNVEAQHSLEAVTATGNITPLTLEFTNPTTSLVASGNVEVGGNVVAGYLYGDGSNITGISSNLDQIVNIGNVTSNTVQFTNATTGIVTTANVEVGGELTVSGNVAVDTNTLFVDSVNNRVGIGTTTPGRFLEVYTGDGTVPGIRLRRGAGSAYTDLHHVGVNVPSSGDLEGLAIITSDGNSTTQEVMRICGNGNVGVGTTSPGQMLSIYTGSTTKPGLSIDRYSTGNYRTEFYQANTGLAIHVGNNTTAPNEKMRITHDGFVGIGTVSPSRTLDVHGAARPSGYPFAIGGTETNRARYVAVEVNPGNNKSSFTKDFVLGGHSRPGFVRVHAAGVASNNGALQWALYAEFTFSVYGTNTFSNRQSGDSGISIASSGTHNGIRVTINGGTNGSYPRAWIEVYSENNIYW